MRQSIIDHIQSCLLCQHVKYSTKVSAGRLQPLPIPEVVWEDIIMYFFIGLPPSKGLLVILVIVDRLTKSANFGALPTEFTASKVAELFVDIVVHHHRFPHSIVFD